MGNKPTIAVAAIVFDDEERVLLVQRRNEPGKGLWTVPGGKVELGETLASACLRELREETGIEGSVGSLVEVVERINRDAQGQFAYHYVIHDFLVLPNHTNAVSGSDASAVEFVRLSDLKNRQVTEGLESVLRSAHRMRFEK